MDDRYEKVILQQPIPGLTKGPRQHMKIIKYQSLDKITNEIKWEKHKPQSEEEEKEE